MENQEQFETVYNDIKDVVKGLAESLQIGAEHVYEVLVKQQVVISITWISAIVVIIIAILIWKNTLLKYFLKKIKEEEKENYSDPFWYWVGVILTALVLITPLIICIGHMDIIITGFVNPEYGAIKEIMELVK